MLRLKRKYFVRFELLTILINIAFPIVFSNLMDLIMSKETTCDTDDEERRRYKSV